MHGVAPSMDVIKWPTTRRAYSKANNEKGYYVRVVARKMLFAIRSPTLSREKTKHEEERKERIQ